MIVNEDYLIRINVANKSHFESLGYQNLKIGEYIKANVFDFAPSCGLKVWIQCDFCRDLFPKKYCHALDCDKHQCGKSECLKQYQKEHYVEKTGYDHPMHNPEVLQKLYDTQKEKYGDWYTTTQEYKEKTNATCQEKYGTDWFFQSEMGKQVKQEMFNNPEIMAHRQKEIEKTCMERYGVKCVLSNQEVRNKIYETNKKRYGCKIPTQNEFIMNKIIKTNREKYGCDYVSQTKWFQDKVAQTFLKQSHGTGVNTSWQQEHIWLEIGGELNYSFLGKRLDIAFPEEFICIEFDGGGHFQFYKRNNLTLENFNQMEKDREDLILSQNWKIIRIIERTSKHDAIYNVKENVDHAKNILKNGDCQKVIINYDDKKIYYDNKEESILC